MLKKKKKQAMKKQGKKTKVLGNTQEVISLLGNCH